MTIETVLKDILETNKKIASYLEKSPAMKPLPSIDDPCRPGPVKNPPVHGEYDPVHDRVIPEQHKAVPEDQYLDPNCIGVMPWADDLAAGISRLDLDGKDTIAARVVY